MQNVKNFQLIPLTWESSNQISANQHVSAIKQNIAEKGQSFSECSPDCCKKLSIHRIYFCIPQ